MGTQKTLGLFQPLQAEEGEIRIEFMEYRPVSQISNKSVIEFDISGTAVKVATTHSALLNISCILLVDELTQTDDY